MASLQKIDRLQVVNAFRSNNTMISLHWGPYYLEERNGLSEGGESYNKDFNRLKHTVQGILCPLLELNSKQNQVFLMEEFSDGEIQN